MTTPPPTPTGHKNCCVIRRGNCRHPSSLDPPRDPMFLDLALRHAELLAEHKGWPPRKPCSRSTCCAATGQIAEPQPVPARIGRQPQPRSPSEFVNPPVPCAVDSFLCRPGKEGAHEKGAAWKEKSARAGRRPRGAAAEPVTGQRVPGTTRSTAQGVASVLRRSCVLYVVDFDHDGTAKSVVGVDI